MLSSLDTLRPAVFDPADALSVNRSIPMGQHKGPTRQHHRSRCRRRQLQNRIVHSLNPPHVTRKLVSIALFVALRSVSDIDRRGNTARSGTMLRRLSRVLRAAQTSQFVIARYTRSLLLASASIGFV
jgi:hypothetical protein